jgi:hypothetical protein
MSNVVMPPTPKLLQIAEKLDQAVGQFISAVQTIPPLGKFESEVEARLLFILVIRHIEAILALVRTDLEHFPFYCRPFRASLNHAWALPGVMDGKASVMAWSSASLLRALTARSSCLSLAQAFSMGFRSGE